MELAMVAETLFPRLRFPKKWMNQAATGLYVTFTFSIFRSESLKEAWDDDHQAVYRRLSWLFRGSL